MGALCRRVSSWPISGVCVLYYFSIIGVEISHMHNSCNTSSPIFDTAHSDVYDCLLRMFAHTHNSAASCMNLLHDHGSGSLCSLRQRHVALYVGTTLCKGMYFFFLL